MITNNLLNIKNVVTQSKHKITHMHYEKYKKTRTQKNIQYYKILLCQK